ncbi:MAG TPA: TIM-barrel domain-containing protein [Geminicoccaceae bacterium]|nr:TIM-barrel domain-containing protein [Geminicoccaceae bacterium]
MPLDPLGPDWTSLAPIAGFGAIERTAHGFRTSCEAGRIEVAAFAPGILRLTFGELPEPDFGILVAEPVRQDVEVGEADEVVALRVGSLRLVLRRGPLRLECARGGEPLLQSTTDGTFGEQLRLPSFARTPGGWLVALALESGEAVFGHGEKYGPLDHRGQLLRSRVEDALGVNAEASYKNTPFAWSPRGWGLFVHTAASVTHGVGHAGWSHRSYVLAVEDALDLFLIAGDTPADLLERYSWLTGRPPRGPRWSLGAWFSRAFYKDADEVLATARELRARRMPADVILFDGQAWQDNQTRFRFEFDPARYPDPRAVLDQLHALNFKVCVWEYPMVSRRGPLFAEFEAKGWLLKDPATGGAVVHDWGEASKDPLSPLQPSGLIDFTHPDAYAYWRDGHAKLFELGVDVIKTDFGEQVPQNCIGHATADGARLHNVYPLLYHRCVFEATERARGQGFVFARAGWAGSQRYPAHWGGDPQGDWEALAASIRGGLSWGLSGGACYATDVGGFLGPPEPELYVRWAQVAVFASHLRFHGTTPREPWLFGDRIEAIIRSWLELRYQLIPYLERCLEEAAATGMPVMRAMPLAFPNEPELWPFETQYMCGPSLLVAPILRPGGRVRLRLPRGDWQDLLTGDRFEGGRSLELTYPLDRFPVFARTDAEIPLGPVVQHTGELEAARSS